MSSSSSTSLRSIFIYFFIAYIRSSLHRIVCLLSLYQTACNVNVYRSTIFQFYFLFSMKLNQCVNGTVGIAFGILMHVTCINIKLETKSKTETNDCFRLLRNAHVFIQNLKSLLFFVVLLLLQQVQSLFSTWIVWSYKWIKCIQFHNDDVDISGLYFYVVF